MDESMIHWASMDYPKDQIEKKNEKHMMCMTLFHNLTLNSISEGIHLISW